MKKQSLSGYSMKMLWPADLLTNVTGSLNWIQEPICLVQFMNNSFMLFFV